MISLNTFSQRQQTLLTLLLQQREGMSVDQLSKKLEISRNAVKQHLSSLENSGFIVNSSLSSTGGRPSKLFSLTENGLELFPRHYSLLSNLLIGLMKSKVGIDEMTNLLKELGQQLALQFKSRLTDLESLPARINDTAAIMQELGYSTKVENDSAGNPQIVAFNCVFHQLAKENIEVCQLDISLLGELLDSKIEHKQCMAKGESCCRFNFTQ